MFRCEHNWKEVKREEIEAIISNDSNKLPQIECGGNYSDNNTASITANKYEGKMTYIHYKKQTTVKICTKCGKEILLHTKINKLRSR